MLEVGNQDKSPNGLPSSDILSFYTWSSGARLWSLQPQSKKKNAFDPSSPPVDVVSRIFTVRSSLGECFRMRLLLFHVRGPTCFEYLKRSDPANDGDLTEYSVFREACASRSLLKDYAELRPGIDQVFNASQLSLIHNRCYAEKLFGERPGGTGQARASRHFCRGPNEVASPPGPSLSERVGDVRAVRFVKGRSCLWVISGEKRPGKLGVEGISDIDSLSGCGVLHFLTSGIVLGRGEDYPALSNSSLFTLSMLHPELKDAAENFGARVVAALNAQQRIAFKFLKRCFDRVLAAALKKESLRGRNAFLPLAPGGDGQDVSCHGTHGFFRQKASVLALESAGIATALFPGGTTAHSGLMLPLEPYSHQLPSFVYGTEGRVVTELEVLMRALLVTWNELLFANRCFPECDDRGLQDFESKYCTDDERGAAVFGSKIFLDSGDSRQLLTIPPRALEAAVVSATAFRSPLPSKLKTLTLTENVRLARDTTRESAQRFERIL